MEDFPKWLRHEKNVHWHAPETPDEMDAIASGYLEWFWGEGERGRWAAAPSTGEYLLRSGLSSGHKDNV